MGNEYLKNKAFEKLIEEFQNSKREKNKQELFVEEQQDIIKRKEKRSAKVENNISMMDQHQSLFKFYDEIHSSSKDKLAESFHLLSSNIVKCFKFNLVDADDAIQEGVVICFEKVDRFVSSKGKAFNYMTTCILNHFRQLYRSAVNYNELKRKYHDFLQFKTSRMIIKDGREIPFYKNNT